MKPAKKPSAFATAAILCAALAACASASREQRTDAATPAPRAFTVEVSGEGPPMILIPGLACGGSVWSSVVDHYRKGYRIHVITLAGFAGRPAAPVPQGALLQEVEAQLAAYLRAERLAAPVVIGHSLGGFLALALAADHPDLVGKVVSVDGVPFLSALFNPAATAEGTKAQAAAMRDQVSGATPEQYAAQNKQALAMMITSPQLVEQVAQESGRSDPRTVGEAMFELMTTDLRPRLTQLKAPTLLIGAGALVPEAARDQLAAVYQGQIADIPSHQFVLAAQARHFIMLDDPAFFFRTVDGFLAGPAPRSGRGEPALQSLRAEK